MGNSTTCPHIVNTRPHFLVNFWEIPARRCHPPARNSYRSSLLRELSSIFESHNPMTPWPVGMAASGVEAAPLHPPAARALLNSLSDRHLRTFHSGSARERDVWKRKVAISPCRVPPETILPGPWIAHRTGIRERKSQSECEPPTPRHGALTAIPTYPLELHCLLETSGSDGRHTEKPYSPCLALSVDCEGKKTFVPVRQLGRFMEI